MRSPNLNYFFRRNKYFFIGCLAGFILSSIFMPAFEDCNSQQNSSSTLNSPQSSLDFRLEQRLQTWFFEVQQPEYEPVLVNTSIDAEESGVHEEHVPQLLKDEPLVRDKKLKFYRPRFHHTELKLKSELLLGILISSDQQLSSSSNASSKQQLIEYMNATSEQLFKDYFNIDVVYFYEESDDDRHLLIASSHKGRSVERVSHSHGHTTKHISILQFLIDRDKTNEYAFFFLMNSQTLLSVENLLEHLYQLTTDDDVLSTMNSPEVRSMLAKDDSILNYGLFLSSSLLGKCQLDVPTCLVDTLSKKSPSSTLYTSHTAYHLSLPFEDISSQDAVGISSAITVYPVVFNSQLAHMIHSAMETARISRLKETLKALEGQIESENKLNTSIWPPGVFGYQKAHTRYEVTKWTYWNTSHVFMPNDIQVIRRLNELELAELRDLRKICSKWIKEHTQISTVYRKFDAVRGLEYLVDFSDNVTTSSRRLQVVKPLNPLELVPDVPYVTENMHLTMVLPVRGPSEVPLAIRFLNNYANVCLKKENHATTLIIVLIYTRHLTVSESAESALEYEKREFGRLKKVSLYIQSKFTEGSSGKMVFLDFLPPDPLSESAKPEGDEKVSPALSSFPSELAYLDLIARSLTTTSSSPEPSEPQQPFLLLHCRSNMLLSTDFLNRVRLNTISDRQVFVPIPFVEYRLRTFLSNSIFQQAIRRQSLSSSAKTDFLHSLAQLVSLKGGSEGEVGTATSTYFDVRKENGYFDHTNHEFVAFYLSDYLRARKLQESSLPMIRNHQSVVKNKHLFYNSTIDLRHLFTSTCRWLTQMRAVEPELRLQHSDTLTDSCEYFESNVYSLQSCQHRRSVGLGPKQKLASIVLEFLQLRRPPNETVSL